MSARKIAFALITSLALTSVAVAQDRKGGEDEGPRAECVEIPCFDLSGRVQELAPTWKEGEDIQEKLIQMEADLATIEPDLKAAIGVAEDAPLEKALTDFQEMAGDKLIVALEGGKVKFDATEDAPDNVKAFVEAGNSAVAKLDAVAQQAQSLEGDITRVGTEGAAAVEKVDKNTLKSNGLKVADLKGELDIVKHNKDAAAGLKDRAASVTGEATRLSGMLTALAK
ncbi:MAG: hypothetical protein VX899_19695 [Myxococcota bacterium]|nr:hypothetical protein [Myxococcota bacterium]